MRLLYRPPGKGGESGKPLPYPSFLLLCEKVRPKTPNWNFGADFLMKKEMLL